MLLEFGSVDCTEDNLFESVCHYECQVGYHIFDSEFINEEFVTSECLEDGEWNRVLPICEKNTCPHDDEDFLAVCVKLLLMVLRHFVSFYFAYMLNILCFVAGFVEWRRYLH